MIVVDVNKPPVDGDTHTWADFMELLAIVNIDAVCTVDMAVDRIHDVPAEPDYDDGDGDGDELEPVSDVVDSSLGRRRRSRDRGKFVDALAMLKWRESEYGEAYPFRVDQGAHSVSLVDQMSAQQYLYIFLLVAANLRFVRERTKTLTDHFEAVSQEVLRDILPRGSQVHLFGKATAGAIFSGSAYEKVKSLAKEIRGTLIASEDSFRRGDTGDSGIDIVAWHPLSDQQCNILVYFGQCACSRSDWPRKQLEASPHRLINTLSAAPPWTTILFVPICFRSVGGGWAVLTEIGSVVMMDRLRLLRNKSDFSPSAVNDEVHRIVDSVINHREGIV